jgi:hypothetical protein
MTENMKWQITPAPDGSFPDAQITHAVLMDIREALGSIRKMLTFFTGVFVIGLVAAVLVALAR